MSFSEQDKRFFIKICKETLKAYLLNETIPAYTRVKSIYKEKYGVFIKLIKDNKIRGYGGVLHPDKDIIEELQRTCINVALYEPRFKPVISSELPFIDFILYIIKEKPSEVELDKIEENFSNKCIIITNGRIEIVFFPEDIFESLGDFIERIIDTYNLEEYSIFTAEFERIDSKEYG